MKKTYKTPVIRTAEINMEDLICQSLGMSKQGVNADAALSRGRKDNDWDDENLW